MRGTVRKLAMAKDVDFSARFAAPLPMERSGEVESMLRDRRAGWSPHGPEIR